jgi:hypothetical protein
VRRTALVTTTAAALLGLSAVPAAAGSNAYGASGWEPSPSAPADVPAGVCAFPVHLDFPVDVVKGRVLSTYPDGSVQREAFNGPLLTKVTNVDSGVSTVVNASGSAIVDFQPDGSQLWNVAGPVLFGFRSGFANNHAPGLFVLAGNYTVLIAATGRTVRQAKGTEKDVCAMLS